MSLVDLLMAAEAAQSHAAVRRTAYRHQHLSAKPLVVVAYNLSGEAAAPLGIMYGTESDAERARLVVAAEPRNRESRFEAINAFAADFVEFIGPYLQLTTVPKKGGGFRQVASDVPQVVVPNRATRSYLGSRLGRSLRYLGLGETHEVPEATQWTGAHLSWFAEHSQLPGQSVFLAMTESLAQHFATGQSSLEDENLATLLAWIEGVPGGLLPALELLEESAYGPVPNPRWEATLAPFVKAYTEGLRADDEAKMNLAFSRVESETRQALKEAYEATHRAIGILRPIAPAAGVTGRWQTDKYEWSAHARRCQRGIPRFARRHDPLRAARALQRWTSAADALEMQQAFDDPLIMARLDADGRCATGDVLAIDWNNREVKPGGKNRTKVPLVELALTAPTRLLRDEIVRWTEDQRVKGVVRSVDSASMTIAVTNGMKALVDASVATGAEMLFVNLNPWEGRDPWAPDEVPWTHRAPTTSDLAGESSLGGGDDDGSPDMTLDELGALPIVGVVDPDDEPGVVL